MNDNRRKEIRSIESELYDIGDKIDDVYADEETANSNSDALYHLECAKNILCELFYQLEIAKGERAIK